MVRRRCVTRGVLAAALVVLTAGESPRAQTSTEEPWPPPGVQRLGWPGVVSPQLVSQVRPNYTSDAMRARVEGSVVLECVVDLDGTVGPVKVVRSLDREHGLDQSAIDTVKQWRFKPGTKDGVPVPTLVEIDMAFRLDALPRLEWPTAFAAMGSAEGWTERDVVVSDLRVRIAFPTWWEAHTPESTTTVFLVHDPAGARMVSVSRPRPSTVKIDRPVPPGRLRQAAEALKAQVATRGSDITGVGQVRSGGRLWVWVESPLRSFEAARAAMPPELAVRMPWESGRLWIFSTATGSELIQVSAMLLYPHGLSEADVDAQARQAGADFVRIIERLSITAR